MVETNRKIEKTNEIEQILKKRIEGNILFVTIRGVEREIPLNELLPLTDQFGIKHLIKARDCSNEELLEALTGMHVVARSNDEQGERNE